MRRLAVTLAAVVSLAPGCERVPAQPPSLTGPSPQNQRSCASELQVGQTTFDELGGQTLVTITAASGCFWNLTFPEWMSVTPQADGVGSRTLTLSIPKSRDTRDGLVQIGDRTVTIRQTPALLLPVECPTTIRPTHGFMCIAWAKLARPGAWLDGPKADATALGRPGWEYLKYFGGGIQPDGSMPYDLTFVLPWNFPPGTVNVRFWISDIEGREVAVTKQITVLR
jgi:hypothetical protein